jgi:HAD superfamily hydrolase (TIGR01509 family)
MTTWTTDGLNSVGALQPSGEPCVVFDMDGVIVDSEPLWVRARKQLVREAGGRWVAEAETAMMGVSSDRWSVYMRDELDLDMTPARIRDEVIGRMVALYREEVPLLPGARAAVEALGRRWPLAIASGSDRVLLDTVLDASGLAGRFAVTVSGEDVAEGKPSPQIYLEACRRLAARPARCVAVEDSGNGILSASAAGMKVVAVPRPGFEPDAGTLGKADAVLADLLTLGPDVVDRVLGPV